MDSTQDAASCPRELRTVHLLRMLEHAVLAAAVTVVILQANPMNKKTETWCGINETLHLAPDAVVALFERFLLLLLLDCRTALAAPRRAWPPLERIVFDIATLEDKK
jgi:hypothetical protein